MPRKATKKEKRQAIKLGLYTNETGSDVVYVWEVANDLSPVKKFAVCYTPVMQNGVMLRGPFNRVADWKGFPYHGGQEEFLKHFPYKVDKIKIEFES